MATNGDTWTRLEGNGLPRGILGKIGLGVSPDDPDRVYALIETSSNAAFEAFDEHEGTLWRSDDGARSWRMVNAHHALTQPIAFPVVIFSRRHGLKRYTLRLPAGHAAPDGVVIARDDQFFTRLGALRLAGSFDDRVSARIRSLFRFDR